MAANRSFRWFHPEHDADRGSALITEFRRLADLNTYRAQRDRLHLTLFQDLWYNGLASTTGDGRLAEVAAMLGNPASSLNENIIRELVLAKHAVLTRTDPRGVLGTSGADYAVQERVDRKQAFVDGLLTHNEVADLKSTAAVHALLVGTGALKILDGTPDANEGLPTHEVVPTWQLLVDPVEARFGKPWSLYQWHGMDRGELIDKFPDKEREIERATTVAQSTLDPLMWGGLGLSSDTDMVEVVEAWRRPASKTSPGRHTIAIRGGSEWGAKDGLLFDEEMVDPIPFALLRFGRPIAGYWGHGLGADLVGIQLELNRTIRARQEALATITPYVLVYQNSTVTADWTNTIGRIVRWSGPQPPQVVSPPAVQPEVWQHEGNLLNAATRAARMTPMSARGEIPEGLKSGEAMRRYSVIENQGLIDDLRAVERFAVDTVKRTLESIARTVKSRDEKAGKLVVVAFGADEITDAEWESREDPIVVSVAPASSLDQTLAGKLEDLQTFRDLGILTDPEDMLAMMNLPDMRRFSADRLATRDLYKQIVETEILAHGKAPPIDPTWNLPMMGQLASRAIDRASARPSRYRTANVELLRQFRTEIVRAIEQTTQAEAQQQAAQAAAAQPQMQVEGPRGPAVAPAAPGAPA